MPDTGGFQLKKSDGNVAIGVPLHDARAQRECVHMNPGIAFVLESGPLQELVPLLLKDSVRRSAPRSRIDARSPYRHRSRSHNRGFRILQNVLPKGAEARRPHREAQLGIPFGVHRTLRLVEVNMLVVGLFRFVIDGQKPVLCHVQLNKDDEAAHLRRWTSLRAKQLAPAARRRLGRSALKIGEITLHGLNSENWHS